jgi:phosphatidylethanolamine-binding protein (PEBP) family uncharacterized protein
MCRALFVSILVVAAACGDDGGSPGQVDASTDGSTVDASTVDAAIDAPAAALRLTSPTIAEGGAIPTTHVCANRGGLNLSPALAFEGRPAGTLSWAVVLTDTSNGLVHSAIHDIPSTLTGLPADVDKVYAPPDVAGAHQTASYQASVRGYNGPCPGTMHTYQFRLYAVGAATTPGTTMNTTKDQLVTILAANNLGTATLTATFTP